MKEHPIIFSTEMVKAILEGRKTQTRRVIDEHPEVEYRCPYGKVGDKLWVRETWYPFGKSYQCGDEKRKLKIAYKADNKYEPLTWKSPIHMPRWASRITLEITDIQVERLQEINGIGYIKEGYPVKDEIYIEYHKYKNAKNWFINLWNSLHKKEYRWEDNPWVWVISFRKQE